jgi:hypothetical protein
MGQLPRAAPCCITAKAGAATNCPSHGQRAPGTSSMRQPEWTTQLRSVGRLLTPALPRTKQAYVHDQPRGLARTHQCRSASKARARPTRVQDARRGRAPTHGAASPDDCSAMAKQKSARGRSSRSEVVRSGSELAPAETTASRALRERRRAFGHRTGRGESPALAMGGVGEPRRR